MKRIVCIMLASLVSLSFADDDTLNVDQGVQQYNWQSCMDQFSSQCENDCATSEDINCKDNCVALAKDKCTAKGLSPDPSDAINDDN